MAQESMGAIPDRTMEHLGSSDVVIIQVPRRLLDMAKALEDGVEPYAASHGAVYRIRTADLLLEPESTMDRSCRATHSSTCLTSQPEPAESTPTMHCNAKEGWL